MDEHLQSAMTVKSDEELKEMVEHKANYSREEVAAAVAELQKRDWIFTEEELRGIKAGEQGMHPNKVRFGGTGWRKNIVTDQDAPAFYSERTIYAFTILFSVLFGAIMMASNFRRAHSRKGSMEVMVFGLLFTMAEFGVFSIIPAVSGLTLIFNMAGALVLNQLFWKKYIGADVKYRARPIWIPLLIGLGITALFVLAVIYGGQMAEAQAAR